MNKIETMMSITKTIDINATYKKVYEYIADVNNWPEYAIVNLKTVKRLDSEWFEIESVHGKGKVKIDTNEKYGIIDTIWIDPNASWVVYGRIIPNHQGVTFMNTFFKPPHFDEATFENAMNTLDIEFNKLKEILEN